MTFTASTAINFIAQILFTALSLVETKLVMCYFFLFVYVCACMCVRVVWWVFVYVLIRCTNNQIREMDITRSHALL